MDLCRNSYIACFPEVCAMNNDSIAKLFTNFANRECRGSSDLYEHLALHIAEDEELLALASHANVGQPVPNLLLGAVHFLLLTGREHQLREYYPSLAARPGPVDQSFTHFRDFCRTYTDQIISILQNKSVQTNEVRRCTYLYPLFCFIYHKTNRPLSLVEIGTSAGLQMFWDQYAYTYGTGQIFGNKDSAVHLTAEIRGGNQPLLYPNSPPVSSRIGIDLHINDLSNAEDHLWLRALIWPEHLERVQLFENAAGHLNRQPPTLIEGDGVALLPQIAQRIAADSTLCVFHTHVANQIPDEVKHKLLDTIRHIGGARDVFHIYNNMWDRYLHLDYFIDGTEYNVTVGETEGHGRWFTWEL